jgi:hypothetical protein
MRNEVYAQREAQAARRDGTEQIAITLRTLISL